MSHYPMSEQEADRHNAKIHHSVRTIKFLHKIHRTKTINCDWILQRIGGVNSQILPTAYWKTHHLDMIGNTILEIAWNLCGCEIFETLPLLSITDLTLKNQEGKTVVHTILDYMDQDCCKKKASLIQPLLTHVVKCNVNSNPSDNNGITHFHIACMTDHAEAVEFFLNNGISVNDIINVDSPILPGYSPLHIAVKFKNFGVVEVLLDHNPDINLKNKGGMTALDILVEENVEFILESTKNLDSVARLLTNIEKNDDIIEYLIDKNALSNLNFSLHVACITRKISLVDRLLQASCIEIDQPIPLDSPTLAGYTSLHLAIQCSLDVAKLLLKNGANIEARDYKGVTPMDLYLQKQDKKLHDFEFILLNHPVWKNTLLSDRKTKLTDLIAAMKSLDRLEKFLEKRKRNIEKLCIPSFCSSLSGYTVLHLAVDFINQDSADVENVEDDMNYQVVKLCLSKGADVTAINTDGYSSLHLAYRQGKTSLIKLLLEYHKKTINPADCDGLSHLHIACAIGNLEVVEKLLSNGTKVNLVFKGQSAISSIQPGWTPLHIAVAENHCEIAKKLLSHGANIYLKDIQGMTPVLVVKLSKNYKEISTILSAVVSKYSVSKVGLSHLHIATFANDLTAVKRLLKNGVNVNQSINYDSEKYNRLEYLREYDGYTALHFGIDNKCQREILEVLFDHGARFFPKKRDGSRPSWKESNYLYAKCIKPIVYLLKENLNLQVLLEKETGLSMLHVTCFEGILQQIKECLNRGLNVNKQSDPSSPIWPGCTPLHVLMSIDYSSFFLRGMENIRETILMLMGKGADVTLLNSHGQSPLHLAFRKDSCYGMKSIFTVASLLLKNQKDYGVNPVDQKGLSHFHIACWVNDSVIVEKFLAHGVDANEPFNCAILEVAAGSSPLHLALINTFAKFIDSAHHKKTVSILIQYGANLLAKDSYDNTPLHIHTGCSRNTDPLNIFIEGGADLNARNLEGETPFETMMDHGYFFLKDDLSNMFAEVFAKFRLREFLPYFIENGCEFNSFNPIHETGFLAELIYEGSDNFEQDIILEAIQKNPHLMVDNMGRTVIHNISSVQIHDEAEKYRLRFAKLVTEFSKLGCDVDTQDKSGRTALHMAASFRNYEAATQLLIFGADVNIVDAEGRTALEYACTPVSIRPNKSMDTVEYINRYEQHRLARDTFITHVEKLIYCKLDASLQNQDLAIEISGRFGNEPLESNEKFFDELYVLKKTTINPVSFVLGDFLSETQAVAEYPFMLESKRISIDDYFRSGNISEEFPETVELLNLQYRKALNRLKIVEEAGSSLAALIGFEMPYLCTREIFSYLTNSELRNLIESGDVGVNLNR